MHKNDEKSSKNLQILPVFRHYKKKSRQQFWLLYMHLHVLLTFLMRKNNITPSNIMEMKNDVTKNQNGVRMALNKVTRFRPVNLLQNKTRFFSIAYIGALC